MRGEEKRFAHVVLFECPWCLHLLSSAFLSTEEQLAHDPDGKENDPLDKHSITMCTCGWVGNALDIGSATRTVHPWTKAFATSQEIPPSQETPEQRDWLFLVAKQIGSISGQQCQNTPL